MNSVCIGKPCLFQPLESNGTSMTTAALLGRRDNIQVSMENLALPHAEVEGKIMKYSEIKCCL